jgi:hypothetical protein
MNFMSECDVMQCDVIRVQVLDAQQAN